MTAAVEVRALYRAVQRYVRLMEPHTRSYYGDFARQHFGAHLSETNPERIQMLLEKGRTNVRWVLAKYSIQEKYPL